MTPAHHEGTPMNESDPRAVIVYIAAALALLLIVALLWWLL